jgi:hypothetical protein
MQRYQFRKCIECWEHNYYQDVSNSRHVTFMVMYYEHYLKATRRWQRRAHWDVLATFWRRSGYMWAGTAVADLAFSFVYIFVYILPRRVLSHDFHPSCSRLILLNPSTDAAIYTAINSYSQSRSWGSYLLHGLLSAAKFLLSNPCSKSARQHWQRHGWISYNLLLWAGFRWIVSVTFNHLAFR